jgi:acyl dehydratase
MSTISGFDEVELGDELPAETPDVSMEQVTRFCHSAKHLFERFTDHDAARKEGFPGAIVPGIMSQGLLAAMIHKWAPGCIIKSIDTVFRGSLLVDSTITMTGAVTDTDDDDKTVELDLTISAEDGRTGVIGTAMVQFLN